MEPKRFGRVLGASAMAMAAGWAVMNLGLLLVLVAFGEDLAGLVRDSAGWLTATAVVVGIAWVVVYLPVYALVDWRSSFWNWECCVPMGALVGAVVPFGFLAIPAFLGGSFWAVLFLLLPATVGTVAAVVGRWLKPWARGCPEEALMYEALGGYQFGKEGRDA